MKEISRKFIPSGMLALVVVSSAIGALLIPGSAAAFVPVQPVITTFDEPRKTEWLLNALQVIGENALLASITTALINTVTYAADRLAYDAAVFIADGGDADDPLFENRTIGEYFADYGASVAADALGQIDESGILGNFSLCEPVLPEITLAFKFGVKSAFERPEPACNFSEIQENWKGFRAEIRAANLTPNAENSLILTSLADAYNPKENDFSVGILLYTDVLNKAQQDAFLAAQRKLFGGFFEDKTNFITGRVETPAEVLQDNFRTAVEATDYTRRQVAIQTLGDSNVLRQIGIHAGSVFTNTLLSRFTEKLYDGLFGGLDQIDINPFDVSSLAGTVDARETFRSFLTATIFSVENYSILDDFGACPYEGKGLYNCVADSSFISAVSRADGGTAITIGEALEDGLLNGSWPLIPSSDTARDQDMYCYTYGYCHGNLVKLRKARIISTGWELAAESSANSDASPVTLSEVVDGFYDCNVQNELDDNHPWCHLIDPNWVLKYPETQCKNQAYGQVLESSVSDLRKTECVDMPSCIDEDGDGNCTGGYGYCVREENVWNFRGEECPDYYGSCTTYEDPFGNEANFLSNTTDASVCTADSAGCLWYNTQKESADGETFNWPDYTIAADLTAAEAEEDMYRNRMYFTAHVETCTADDAGCRELVSRDGGTTLNMMLNPSFERDDDADGRPDGWFVEGTGETYSDDGEFMLSGTDAINPGSDGLYYQDGIVLTQAAEYTFSFYAAQNAGSITTGGLLSLEASNGESVDFRGYSLNGDCAVSSTNTNILNITGTPEDTDYERFSCTFTVPTLSDSRAEVRAFVGFLRGDLWIDSVQLEQESSAGQYHEGYSDAVLDLAYVKVPPTYLGCTGTSDDPAECENYAGMCSGIDVGCSYYAPTNGDPAVIGIAGELDACPAECVGYDTFKQEPTRYEPDGDFPIYFIPDSAETCTAQYVGCDEFTDITTEEPSYFTYVRACVTSDQADANEATSDAGAIFYTWEGSDTDGYQLKTWNVLESDMGTSVYTYTASRGTDDAPDLAPCTSWSTTDEGIRCNDDSGTSGTLDSDSEFCDEHGDTITNPDCREFYDTEGTIHYREWTDTVTVNDDCVTYRKTNIVGADTATQTANCEESGGYFDTSTTACRYYGYAEESYECPAEESGCREYTGGRSRNSRQAFIEYFEEDTLSHWDAVSATDVTLSNESIATDGHSLFSDDETVWTHVGGDGTECATEGGCDTAEGILGGTCALANGETYCGTLSDEVFVDKTYVVSFWAKGSGTLSVGFDTSRTSGIATIDAGFATGTDAIALNTDWQQYSYGPKNMSEDEYPDFGDGATALVFAPGSGTMFYIDNVVLREGEDNINVIQNSWVTPTSCDETESGTASAQYMLGCQEYTNQDGETSYLKSFSELCDEDKIGCESYFMTQESDAVGGSVYGARCSTLDGVAVTEATSCYSHQNETGTDYDTESEYLCTIGVATSTCEFNLGWYVPVDDLEDHLSYVASTVISPADKDIFLVVSNDMECSSDVAGCVEVGLPVFNQDHTAVENWETVYLMNTPADYSSTLCSQDELFCQEWTDNEGSISYFKDPQNQTCEYRSDVTVNNVTYNGWFKTDTDALCDPDYVIGGDEAGIWRNGDDEYAKWVGECAAQYDTCSEFQDVSDLATDDLYGEADGTSYFYMNNDALEENSLPDSQKCNGEVSQTEGCGMFNDTSNPRKSASATATYIASTHADALFGGQQNDLVDPIDCEGDSTIITPNGDSVDLCANRCWYSAEDYYDINGTTESHVYDGSCYDDTDCRPLTSESGAEVNGFCASSFTGIDAPRLENESNIVLKVNRDRECSEWLSCSDAQTTWDERTNSYVTICGDIGLCEQYSGTGDASFCSAWKDDGAAVVLDVDEYSSRDVSWYGDDYSGYAIPGLLPVDQLSQVNIVLPYTCETSDLGLSAALVQYDGDPCLDDGACGGTPGSNDYCTGSGTDSDYRLAYVAGSCDSSSGFGGECSVGYCENTGSACVDSEACGTDGGDCLIGTCYTVSTDLCASSADCDGGDRCLGGYCATDNGDAVMENYRPANPDAACRSGESFRPSVNFKTGTCLYDQCVLAPNGSTFAENASEGVICRAYPEINSPFENEIVETWQDPTDLSVPTADSMTSENSDALPISFVQNFENVQTCALGEDCSCLYKKITYDDSGTVRYSSQDADIELTDGICSTYLEGATCTSNSDCVDSLGNVGECMFPSQIDDVLGLEGYCLEHDSSTNIFGDRDTNACLTWLPVDQLAGSTDLYAKYTSAGYFEDTSYCSYVDEFQNVTTIGGLDDTIYCSERDQSEYGFDSCVQENLFCPIGFYMIMGPYPVASTSDVPGTLTETCKAWGDNNCPFVCVPENAMNSAGESCDIESLVERGHVYSSTPVTISPSVRSEEELDSLTSAEYDVRIYYYDGAQEFDAVVEDVQLCKTYGRLQHSSNLYYTTEAGNHVLGESFTHITGMGTGSHIWGCVNGAGSCGWHLVGEYPTQNQDYLGCRDLLQVADASNPNIMAPYTDRLLNTSNTDSILSTSSPSYAGAVNFEYTNQTARSPFGRAEATYHVISDSSDMELDVRPPSIAACGDSEYITGTPWSVIGMPIMGGDGVFSCAAGDSLPSDNDINDPEARSFVEYIPLVNTYYDVVTGGEATATSVWSLLQNIFARSLSLSRFDDGVWDTTEQAFSQEDDADDSAGGFMEKVADYVSSPEMDDPLTIYDLAWDERSTGNRPSIWAVDFSNCYNEYCEEDFDHPLSVNDQNEGDIEADMFYRAYLKFYAAADKDQLPIRRIIVDWGDDEQTGSDAPDNFYKNHRGLQEDKEISICETDPTFSDYEWGMNSDSCDPNYFSYNHIYTCNPSEMPERCDDGGDDGIIDNAPCTLTGNECVYRPSVHIRDNWGICTGTCTVGGDGAEKCVDNDGDINSEDYSELTTFDECNYSSYPENSSSIDPWVYYDGTITVTP